MVFLSLTPNYTTACETDDLARHTTTILLHFAIHKKYKLLHEFDGHFLTVLCESLNYYTTTKSEEGARRGCQIPARQRPKRNFTLNSSSVRSCCFSKLMLMLVISTPIPNAGYCYMFGSSRLLSQISKTCAWEYYSVRGGRFQGLGMAFLLHRSKHKN